MRNLGGSSAENLYAYRINLAYPKCIFSDRSVRIRVLPPVCLYLFFMNKFRGKNVATSLQGAWNSL